LVSNVNQHVAGRNAFQLTMYDKNPKERACAYDIKIVLKALLLNFIQGCCRQARLTRPLRWVRSLLRID